MHELPSIATEYVEVLTNVTDRATDLPIDPSADVVEFAFVALGAKPASGDWKRATWLAVRRAGLLVGPTGGLVLPVGSYAWWVRVTDNPEQPAEFVDELRIT